MGFMDKLKDLEGEAERAAATHKDTVEKAIEKAEELADKQTGGQHHDAIVKAGEKADEYSRLRNPAPDDAPPPLTAAAIDSAGPLNPEDGADDLGDVAPPRRRFAVRTDREVAHHVAIRSLVDPEQHACELQRLKCLRQRVLDCEPTVWPVHRRVLLVVRQPGAKEPVHHAALAMSQLRVDPGQHLRGPLRH